jgi:hypothetical protein
MPKGPEGQKRKADVIANRYNLACINSVIGMSPAMAARLTETLWDIGILLN